MIRGRDARIGLALSGGGLRASFFHIGMLAALADRDILRRVEVISTVSGGSIIGALYSIKVKRLLESKADDEITQKDFQRLVAEVASQFLHATQKNIRLRAFANPFKNARMARADFSRSDRIGELLDTLLYRPALAANRRKPVIMTDLLVGDKRISPEKENRHRRVKIPILIINATSLNTGRNWRFEAVRMGEPPRRGPFVSDIDMRMRLDRPPSYDAIGTIHRWMRLGHAVAASAAVPAIMHPLAISDLYEDVRVELVDGGIHDNQGVGALLDRGCDQVIVSDGSSQMVGEQHPGTTIPAVLLRSHEILTCRVREEQLLRAHQLHRKDVYLAHLQKGLPVEHVPYITPEETFSKLDGYAVATTRPLSGVIHPRVQEALAQIRTDLDAFHDAEGFSLMYAGYVIADMELQPFSTGGQQKKSAPYPWEFTKVASLVQNPTSDFLKVLQTGAYHSWKVFHLYPALLYGTLAIMIGLVLKWGWQHKETLLQPVVPMAWMPNRLAVLLLLLGVILTVLPVPFRRHNMGWLKRKWRYVRTPFRFLGRVFFRAIPWVLATIGVWFALFFFNPLYLRAGQIERLQKSHAGSLFVERRFGNNRRIE